MAYKINENRWMRSKEGWLAGVCEGLAESFDLSPGWIRAAWAVSLFLGFGFILYIVAAFCLPVRGEEHLSDRKKLLGVCYRLSQKIGIDVGLVRIAMVFIALSSLGTTSLIYIVLHFVIPENEDQSFHFSKEN